MVMGVVTIIEIAANTIFGLAVMALNLHSVTFRNGRTSTPFRNMEIGIGMA